MEKLEAVGALEEETVRGAILVLTDGGDAVKVGAEQISQIVELELGRVALVGQVEQPAATLLRGA